MANDINISCVSGRLTAAPSLRRVQSGAAVLNFSIAVSKSRMVNQQWQEEVSYIDVEIWGPSAERLSGRVTKGTPVTVAGSLLQKRWEKDGQRFSRLVVSAHAVQVHAAGQTQTQGGGQQTSYGTQQQGDAQMQGGGNPAQYGAPKPSQNPAQWEPSPDEFPEDIPF